MQRMRAELLADARAMIGEGPIWDVRRQQLIWVDIPAGAIHRLDPLAGPCDPQPTGQPVGSVGIRADGGLVAALRDGFAIISDGTGDMQLIEVEKSVSSNRMNDGTCDCRGRFWAGTMAVDHTPRAGTLYRLERTDGAYRASPEVGGITVANGLDWSPDNKLMYYIDSPTQRIDVFDFDADEGRLANRRPLVQISESEGLPDGMTVDGEGHIWVALFYAGKLRRYTPSGRAVMEVDLPVTLVTSCAFGGAKLDELYVTTARHRLTPAEATEQTHAGGIFVCRPGPIGRAPFQFAAQGT
ncbi:MAG TPA: SMP-30/gluconolactonase/LRE family protein [Lichenihabitans sp.]|nr:SMP-30/gluconolactonase/LRE family protein [Lichenihabitans sp.]